ncbi:hypothetical protein [Streptomyces akebiae]|uniref:Uncharacterized protein n=1 Tax=Streptomyces akebiae TaxID=2865673 RepID=A0ABX8XV77_9ACTN|nr:hypothetical protein [Streptomyces akebiae]QYX79497.1 hypothetical protein K1J60_25950 [Streptomyces akebiae]
MDPDTASVFAELVVRQRVRNCTDPDLLQIWVDRAYDVTDAAELFDDDQA